MAKLMTATLILLFCITQPGSSACPPPSVANEPDFELEESRLGDRVLLLRSELMALNLIAIDAGEGIVVVDSLTFPSEARKGRRIIEEAFGKKITHVINTHHHFDHTFGNQVFADATIIAHEWCREDMLREYSDVEDARGWLEWGFNRLGRFSAEQREAEKQSFKLTPPEEAFSRKKSYKIGDLTFILYHHPGLHTRNYITIHIPELELLYLRGTFYPDSIPEFQGPVDLPQMVADFEEILACRPPLRHIVQGHGDSFSGEGIDLNIGYLKDLLRARERFGGPKEISDDFFGSVISARIKSHPNLAERHERNLAVLFASK